MLEYGKKIPNQGIDFDSGRIILFMVKAGREVGSARLLILGHTSSSIP